MKKALSFLLATTILCSAQLPCFSDDTPVYIAAEESKTFPAPSEWAKESIEKANLAGITEKQYMYTLSITREEFCEIIYNLIKLADPDIENITADNIFTDTENAKIAVLYSLKIINGTSETFFSPDAPLTREQAATILFRAAQYIGIDIPQLEYDENADFFEDKNSISSWAILPVYILKEIGIINGTDDNIFSPQDTYTAEQAIASVVRIYERISSFVSPDYSEDKQSSTTDITDTVQISSFYTDEALKLISEAAKLASDKDYISYYTANKDMKTRILALAKNDFTTPEEIYYLSADRTAIIEKIKTAAGSSLAETDLIEKLLDYGRFSFMQLATTVNATQGPENLAALTMLTVSKGYIMPEDFKNNFALYFKYDGDYSALVSFSKYGDGVISAQMSFVSDGNDSVFFSRINEISALLGKDAFTVAKVNNK